MVFTWSGSVQEGLRGASASVDHTKCSSLVSAFDHAFSPGQKLVAPPQDGLTYIFGFTDLWMWRDGEVELSVHYGAPVPGGKEGGCHVHASHRGLVVQGTHRLKAEAAERAAKAAEAF